MSKKKRLQNRKIKQEEQIKSQIPPKDKSPVVHQRNKIEHYLTILHRELTEKQKKFIELALDKKVKLLLVSGPAGSTKTYLSVLAALLLMNEKKISDIVYVRSIVESADVKMGTLPGEADDKLSPYKRPLIDKLDELLPKEDIQYLIKDNRIEGLPILLSSRVLTEFVIITLTESVRAHGDPDFCQIQNISRMSPSLLKGNVGLEYQFKSLCSTCLTFMENWDGVPPDAIRMYARRKPAQEASEEYVNACQRQFDTSGTQYCICHSVDSQGPVGSRAERSQAMPNSPIVRYLNGKLREPQKLIMFIGAKFEATVNGKGFNQSQLLVMCEIPNRETIRGKLQIELFAAPSARTI